MHMHDSTFSTGSNRSGKGHRTTARPNGVPVYSRLPLQKISVTVVHGDGRNRAGRATSTQLTCSRDRKPYVYIRYTNRSAWPYMRGTCRIRCSRDPQNRGFRETVTGWLVPIRLGPRASTACAIYIPTSSNIPCMHTGTTARARSSGPPERAYAHAAREH